MPTMELLYNGKQIDLIQFDHVAEKAIIDKMVDYITTKLRNMNCQKHNKPVKIDITGQITDLDALKLDVHACCQEFKDAVQERLNG